MYMKFCLSNCALAITFLVADVYMVLSADETDVKEELIASLNLNQRERYNSIVNERRNIYFKSYLVGLALSAVFLFATKDFRKANWMSAGIVCTVGGITLLSNYLCYILTPKSDYMIMHLESKKQRSAWLKVYRHMQAKYHTGLIFGIIAAMILARATC